MNAKEFFLLVKDMRARQKEYFKTRSHIVLTESKRLEAEVDKEISRAEKAINKQNENTLF